MQALSHSVILVLGTTIHEFADAALSCGTKLVDRRAKHDHYGI